MDTDCVVHHSAIEDAHGSSGCRPGESIKYGKGPTGGKGSRARKVHTTVAEKAIQAKMASKVANPKTTLRVNSAKAITTLAKVKSCVEIADAVVVHSKFEVLSNQVIQLQLDPRHLNMCRAAQPMHHQ